MALTYELGDKVYIANAREGYIRYRGNVTGKSGLWYGVELTVGKGSNNGTLDGKTYFQCPTDKGIFLRPSSILMKLNNSPKKGSSKPVPTPGSTAITTIPNTSNETKEIKKYTQKKFCIKEKSISNY